MDAEDDHRTSVRIDELLAERARLWEEVHRLRAERREVEHYRKQAEYVTGSLSWRITVPLRIGKQLKIKLQRKLDERSS
jgi:predicted metal-dependent hydrolase